MKKKVMILILLVTAAFVIVLTALFSLKKALVSLGLVSVGMAFPSLPLFYIGKLLLSDIQIMRKGTRYTGRCVGFERGTNARFSTLIVEAEDHSDHTRKLRFHALRLRFRYPYEITVYSTDDLFQHSSLGTLTIAPKALYFLMFFLIWLICTAGTVHEIIEIIKPG